MFLHRPTTDTADGCSTFCMASDYLPQWGLTHSGISIISDRESPSNEEEWKLPHEIHSKVSLNEQDHLETIQEKKQKEKVVLLLNSVYYNVGLGLRNIFSLQVTCNARSSCKTGLLLRHAAMSGDPTLQTIPTPAVPAQRCQNHAVTTTSGGSKSTLLGLQRAGPHLCKAYLLKIHLQPHPPPPPSQLFMTARPTLPIH